MAHDFTFNHIDNIFSNVGGMVSDPLQGAGDHNELNVAVDVVNILADAGRDDVVDRAVQGVDQRVVDLLVDEEISIGDYVITGGELAAAVIIDATCRYIPGVVGREESVLKDSFENGLIEHPHYTRPETFENLAVPQILLSGNHAEIKKWRIEESEKATCQRRKNPVTTK